ncbi:MAG TPA: 3-oxosteroid 1-dehydrogenase [Actinophytocola sp.]|uniref:3-oxosteroid 1-dehydrogenase n=1 Tax=Actinophytocola sp. TaxID=1872138 RepID=UPI002DBD9C6A|nr:3-oxosteroid 1-dehydrogenase [Actinophytocola sp.]HEU5474175.1 3-oxosteroid 1-dehydrogenase [Actinophytocola sp.]
MTSAATEFDVVVAGAGAAGMTAALVAARAGLRALVVEKAGTFGGSTARSGGGVWAPNNNVLRAAGVPDTPRSALTYLAHITGPEVPDELRRAFLDHAPAVISFLQANTPLRFGWVRGYPDYYPEAPGGLPMGRSIEARPLDARVLGTERAHLAPPYLKAPNGMAITQADYRWMNLMARHPRGMLRTARVAGRRAISLLRKRELLTMGQALAAGLRAGLTGAGVPVWLDTPLVSLHTEAGRVTGVVVLRDGEPLPVRALRGVVLTTGGFEHNERMRKEYQAEPIGTEWTVGAPGNTGDGIEAGLRLGAAVGVMDDAWWGPSVPLPHGPYFCLAERTLPGCMVVNQAGARFVNEAAPYVDAVHAMYDGANIPAWLIADQRYRNRYVFAGLGPRQPFPRRWYAHGAVHRAGTVEDLAAAIGMPAESLRATVDRFNTFADTGLDKDFHRGESRYDHYYGDPRNRPNPCLGRIDRPPFYAIRIVPGDLGTKGGLRTDARARVLRPDGSVIEGLYAAGNASAPVMGHTYAGPGATLGPALVFGYLAALDLGDDTCA